MDIGPFKDKRFDFFFLYRWHIYCFIETLRIFDLIFNILYSGKYCDYSAEYQIPNHETKVVIILFNRGFIEQRGTPQLTLLIKFFRRRFNRFSIRVSILYDGEDGSL